MAGRYIRQIEFTNSVYMPDCPVALEKGAVLLDTKTNTYQLQLKLANVGMTGIASVRIFVEALDHEGNPAYPGIYGSYNENAAVGSAFGTKRLLPLPNNEAVKFRVYVEEVTTASGVTAIFERSKYKEDRAPQDFAALREDAFQADLADRERQEKVRKTMWGAKWYHLVFAISTLLSIILANPLPGMSSFMSTVIILLFLGLWVFVWSSMGTPLVLKRSAMAALLIAGSSILFLLLFISNWSFMRMLSGTFFSMLLWRSAVGFLPFLCIFLNANRFNKSPNFTQSLLFWKTPQLVGNIEMQKTAKTCASCSASLLPAAKFCTKCGERADGQ